MKRYEQWDEICQHFAGGRLKPNDVSAVQKMLELSDVQQVDYLETKFALWLDFRTTDDLSLHGSGRRIDNSSEGITLQIEKDAETADTLNTYIYLFMDAQLNIKDRWFSFRCVLELQNCYILK